MANFPLLLSMISYISEILTGLLFAAQVELLKEFVKQQK
jgi:hypothetical protein